MSWVSLLESWGYPRAVELASTLNQLGLQPDRYSTPRELGETLILYVRRGLIPAEFFDPFGPVKDFLKWLWDQVAPYAVGVGLLGLGAFITWIMPGDYKLMSFPPIGGGLYLLLHQGGVV